MVDEAYVAMGESQDEDIGTASEPGEAESEESEEE